MDRGIIIGIGVAILVSGLMAGLCVYSAKMQAEVINRKYGTDYTTQEMFFAGDVVQKVTEGQKHKIELTHKDK